MAEHSHALRIGDLRSAIWLAQPAKPFSGAARWYGRYIVAWVAPEQRTLTITGAAIEIAATRPNYGGLRWWFCCASCGRRVGVLYTPGGVLACRHCWRITYQSSNDSDWRITAMLKAGDLHCLKAAPNDVASKASSADLLLILKLAQRLKAI